MKKTIRDLFTEEEWETLTEEFLPRLAQVAALPLNAREEDDESE